MPDSRDFQWYAVICEPQKEFLARRLLAQAGFATFLPARKVWRYANRFAKARKQKKAVNRVVMPRYIFIGVNDATAGWPELCRLIDLGAVEAIISTEGVPFQLPHGPLRDLMWKHSAGKFDAPEHEKYMDTDREFTVGDSVETEDGLFRGKVIELTDDKAKILINLFGSERISDVPIARLVGTD